MPEQNPLQVIYNELIDFVGCYVNENSEIFIGNRPDKTTESMQRFVVISLPTEIKNLTAGNDDFAKKTFGVFEVYYKAKTDTTLNFNAQSDLVYQIKKGFPYVTTHIEAVRPTILHDGYDKNGFHVTTITFRLRTKPNAFTNQ